MKKVRKITKFNGRFLHLIGTNGGRIILSEIYEMVKEGTNFEVNPKGSKKDLTSETYVACLKQEERSKGDVKLLTRTIRNGGFINYIKKLEKENGKSKRLIK